MVPRGKPCGPAGLRDEDPRERPRDEGAPQPGLSFAKRQPGGDLTVFRAATAFATPMEHRISQGVQRFNRITGAGSKF